MRIASNCLEQWQVVGEERLEEWDCEMRYDDKNCYERSKFGCSIFYIGQLVVRMVVYILIKWVGNGLVNMKKIHVRVDKWHVLLWWVGKWWGVEWIINI